MVSRLKSQVWRALHGGLARLELKQVKDPRSRINRRWSLSQLLTMALAGLCAGSRNLAEVEELSRQLSVAARRTLRLPRRVADTTLRDVLVRLDPVTLMGRLWHQIRVLQRRKALCPVELPFGVVVVDGKSTTLEAWGAGFAQRQISQGRARGLLRTMTCTLSSSRVPVCIHAEPIPPATNEDGHFSQLIDRLLAIFGKLDLFRMVCADAGSCSRANAQHVRTLGLHYLFRLNEKQPTLFAEAQRLLDHLPNRQAQLTREEHYRGGLERRSLFLTTAMAGFLDWTDLAVVLRVQRERFRRDGSREFVHDRYFISSLPECRLSLPQWYAVVRGYWASVENGCHHTFDTAFAEDDCPWITADDRGALNTLLLRRMAYNLVVLFRGRTLRGDSQRATPWKTVLRWFDIALLTAEPERVAVQQGQVHSVSG